MGSEESCTGPDSELGKRRPWPCKGWLKARLSWLINSIMELLALGVFTNYVPHHRDTAAGGSKSVEEGISLVHGFRTCGP